MLRTITVLLALLVVAPLCSSALHAAENGGFFNPKVSSREVALNQAVHVVFTTLRPRIKTVSPEQVVANALSLPDVTEHWRLLAPATVEQDEKIRTLRIAFDLLPRHSGELPLPEIPATWLEGGQVASFGSVLVLEQVAVGGGSRPVPSEVEALGGFTWGMSEKDLRARIPSESNWRQDASTGLTTVSALGGLNLVLRDGFLAEGRIHAPELPLPAAKASFIDRWGDPQPSSDGGMLWILGWVRIDGRPTADGRGTHLTLVHEEMLHRASQDQVRSSVFALLDAPAPVAPVAPVEPEAPADAEEATEAPQPSPEEQAAKERAEAAEKEWERALQDSGSEGSDR